MALPIDTYGILIQRRLGTTSDPFVSKSDTITVVNGLAVLQEIPDKFSHVTIPNMYEIYDGVPDSTEFQVNYNNGNIIFNTANNGKQFVATYMGTGAIYVSAQRIATSIDDNGNITQFLSDLTSSANTATTDATNAASSASGNAIYAKQQGDYAKSVGDNVQTIWKSPVSTFSAIATTYPSPSQGWTVQCIDTNYIYRYETATSTWEYTQQYNDSLVTDLQNKTLGMRQSELIPSSIAIETDGLTLGNFTIPFSNIKLGTVTLG
jgi:hypothetical protein